jgi:hypothetical protein
MRAMSARWGIQTTYLPRENLRFLEEWLAYHHRLGAEFFYLYDNTGSRQLDLGNSVAVTGKNKYGIAMDFRLSDGDIADIESAIIKKYPVTKIRWQPRQDGEIVYGQVAACDHFSELVRTGWCAFIDIDEFLYAPHAIGDLLEGDAIVVRQKRFDDRFGYDRTLEISKTFSIDTSRWGPKLVVNMQRYIKGGVNIHTLTVNGKLRKLDPELVRFNHYNHNRRNHEWLLQCCSTLDPQWLPVPFEQVFNERCELLLERSRSIDYATFVQDAAKVR